MYSDWALAFLHHLAVFALFGVFAAQAALLRGDLSGPAIPRLARLDLAYGLLSLAVIGIGLLRLHYGLKGWDAYAGNHAFWGKMTAFALVGILSIGPSRLFVRWRKAWAADPGFTVPPTELRTVKRFVGAEALFFALIVIFAAAMARGIGA